MGLRQRQKERKRRGNRQDRKERGMDYRELGKGGMYMIEGRRIRGWEDRKKEEIIEINGRDGHNGFIGKIQK